MEIPKSIAIGLVEAQRAAKDVEKDGDNTFHKYKYATADSIAAEARLALNGAGLALCRVGWTPIAAVDRGEGWVDPARLLVTYVVVAESDGAMWQLEPVSVPVLPEKGRPEDKAEAAALTYSAGYVALGLLQIERVDAKHGVDQRNDSNREPARRAPAQQQTQQRQAPANGRTRTPLADCRTPEELRAWCLSWGKDAINAGKLDLLLERGAEMEIETAVVRGWLGI